MNKFVDKKNSPLTVGCYFIKGEGAERKTYCVLKLIAERGSSGRITRKIMCRQTNDLSKNKWYYPVRLTRFEDIQIVADGIPNIDD